MKKVVVEIHSEMNDDFEYEVFKTKIKVSNDVNCLMIRNSYEWDEMIGCRRNLILNLSK
jgi:hypothetical protein